jgi:hypothetical protein
MLHDLIIIVIIVAIVIWQIATFISVGRSPMDGARVGRQALKGRNPSWAWRFRDIYLFLSNSGK